MACRQHGDKLVLTNVNSSKYAEKVFELDPKQVRTGLVARCRLQIRAEPVS